MPKDPDVASARRANSSHLFGDHFTQRVVDNVRNNCQSPSTEGSDNRVVSELAKPNRYRGTNPSHHDNAGLRMAMQRQVPLIYFHGIVPGFYEAAWPVFIVEDHPDTLTFIVAIDDQVGAATGWQANDTAALTARRKYITAVVRQRLHQRSFRQRVLRAYQQCCAICRLRHDELLEASHILPDGHPRGEPIVPNGLALCKLHHAAFDSHIIGVTPDLEVTVRLDILEEIDGPMLLHGLQSFQGRRIHVPRLDHLKPNRDFLAERYDLFRHAS
jgi:putative restriction endonuclease